MSKNHFFSNIFKKISIFINSLLENKLNKLNFLFEKDKFLAFVSFKRFFTFLSILIVLAFSYLYLPNLHNKSKLSNIIKNQLIGAKKNCKKFTQIKHYINLNNIFFN